MKFFVIAFAIVAVTAAAVAPSSDYLPPEPSSEYLPPASGKSASSDAENGYRYKTVRRLKYRARHRRDLSSDYLPPVQGPSSEYLPPTEAKAADNGYRYKTVRKLKYRARHRRDVSELVSNDYLPPTAGAAAQPQPKSAELSADGYRYKTVRRLKYRRHRREADPEPEAEADAAAPSSEYLPPVEGADAGVESGALSADGYRYKTVRRLKYRRRRREADPEPEAEADAAAPSSEYLPPVEGADAGVESGALSADGYRYKTVRRLKYRRRRREADPEPEAEADAAAPSSEYLPPVEGADAGVESGALSADGYRYKTVRRLKYRRRRREADPEPEAEADAAAPSSEYLPPVEGADAGVESGALSADGYRYKTVRRLKYRRRRREADPEPEAEADAAAPSSEYLPPVEGADAGVESGALSADGYRYKTVRRLKYRRRRREADPEPEAEADAAAPSSEYLPPVEGADAGVESGALSADGYRYKTVRRLKYRRRRREADPEPEAAADAAAPSSEYLPPVEGADAGVESGALSADGYRYKTVRRLKYRRRRREADPEPEAEADAAAPSSEYLPPVEGADAGVESGALSADGYRYKTVRRLKYRRRRREADPEPEAEADAAAPSSEYLPPVEGADAGVESGALSADGYRYKTVRRLKYRRRRREADPEPEAEADAAAPSSEYLPPVEGADAGVESGALSADGYRYKTVRRLKYRRRRREADPEPEAEADAAAPSSEYLPPVEGADAGVESGALSADGYRYKTVRRLKYRRRRRDAEPKAASATPASEYLPPADATAEAEPKSAELAKDGYHYRTIKRLRYRH